MTITVNGESETYAEGITIRAVLAAKNLLPEKVAIELNKRLVRSANNGYDRALAEGDVVEIVTFVGGG